MCFCPKINTLCLNNVQPLTCYNLDIHFQIAIIFGRSVTHKVRISFVFPPHLSSASPLPCKRENPEDCALVLCARNTVQLLQRSRLAFSWTTPHKSPKLNALVTRFRESYSGVSMSHESKRLKKSSSNWLNSGNAVIQRVKNVIFVFPVLPGGAAQVIPGGIVRCLDCLVYR